MTTNSRLPDTSAPQRGPVTRNETGSTELSLPLPAARFLTRRQAAIYVGVSVSTFDHEVRIGLWPHGRRRGAKGGRLTWDRALLDAAADQQSGLSMAQAGVASALESAETAAWEERLNATPSIRSQRSPKKAA